MVRRRVALILGFGVVIRLVEYAWNRGYWMDEASIASCIRESTWRTLFGPMGHNQLAPVGFLALERWALVLLGDQRWALRLWPFVAGISALFLFRGVSRRFLADWPAFLALAMFAVSDELVYFSSELKPYSCDVLAALIGLWLGDRLQRPEPLSWSRIALLAVLGALLLWFSFPAIFVLAGVGLTAWLAPLLRHDHGRVARVSLVGLAWAASFAGVHAVSKRQLVDPHAMQVFWNFAFPPRDLTSVGQVGWTLRRLGYLFVNPLSFYTPLGWNLSALPPLLCALLGLGSLARRDSGALGMLVAPIAFTLLANGAWSYPFHGRLVLFLTPALLMLVAEGAGWLSAVLNDGRWIRAGLVAVLLLWPSVETFEFLTATRNRIEFNAHGDRRPEGIEPAAFPFGK